MISLTYSVIAGLWMFAAGTAIGYYIAHRGFEGVKNDLNDIKKDYDVLEAKFKRATKKTS